MIGSLHVAVLFSWHIVPCCIQPVGKVLDGVVSQVLNSMGKPMEVVLSVSQSKIELLTSGKKEVNAPLL